MITSRSRIDRRTVLRGAGGLTIGLPFLSAMLAPGRSHADDTTPQRFVVFYHPGGTLLDKWRPVGTPASFTLQPMLAPLLPFLDRLVFVDGVDLAVTQIGSGHAHSRGMAGVLTGQQLLPGNLDTNGATASFADGPSIDQLLAAHISAAQRFPSLEMAAGWSTGTSAGGQPHPGNIINYRPATTAGHPATPVPPATDPLSTFSRVFSCVVGEPEAKARELALGSSVLDGVQEDFTRLMRQLGAEDRARLEQHLALVQEAKLGLQQGASGGCMPPPGVNPTPGYYDDTIAERKVPEKGKIMSDMLVAALACDLTRVGTLQWSDSEARFLLGFLQDSSGAALKDHHHGYQHERGFQPEVLEIIYRFYAENLAYLLRKLDAVQEGNGSLLDNTLVLCVTELQHPESHEQNNMPFLLAGKAGGKLSTQRWLQVPAQPHNNLLVSILNLFGVAESKFGHPDFCTGALAGLA